MLTTSIKWFESPSHCFHFHRLQSWCVVGIPPNPPSITFTFNVDFLLGFFKQKEIFEKEKETLKVIDWKCTESYIVLKALPYVTWFFLFEMPIDTYINNYESVNRVIERNGDSRKENNAIRFRLNSLFQQSCSYNPLFGFLDQWKLFIWFVVAK